MFLHVALNNPSVDIAPILFFPLFCTLFCDKNRNHANIHRFLYLYAKCKTGDKTLEQRFLKEFKGTCKASGES